MARSPSAQQRRIKLKLVVPRNKGGRPARQALWRTHKAVNDAISQYIELLLACRGENLQAQGGDTAGEDSRTYLTQLVNTSRQSRGLTPVELSERDFSLFAELYDQLVTIPSDPAHLSVRLLYPLADPDSQALQGVEMQIASNPPSWVDTVAAGKPEGFAAAHAWAKEQKEALDGLAARSLWVKQLRANPHGNEWPTSFIRWLKVRQAQDVPAAKLLNALRKRGFLPLFRPVISGALGINTISRWDRHAWGMACAHLARWEKQRLAAQARWEILQCESLEAASRVLSQPETHRLRAFEVTRYQEMYGADNPEGRIKITPRMLRGWPRLREAWRASCTRSPEDLWRLVKQVFAEGDGSLMDKTLCRWLAETSQHDLWDHSDPDPILAFAHYNALSVRAQRAKPSAEMTLVDARLHPSFTLFDAPGGTNLQLFNIEHDKERQLTLTLPLLDEVQEGLRETSYSFRLAPSGQLQQLSLERANGRLKLGYRNGAGVRFSARVGQSLLIFDRNHLRRRTDAQLSAGDIGAVYFSLSLEVEERDALEPLPLLQRHFGTAWGKKSAWEDTVQVGARVMSVDLGVRELAACSVFEVKEALPDTATLAYPIKLSSRTLYAVHKRSFILRHEPVPDRRTKEWRKQADSELKKLSDLLERVRQIRQLRRFEGDARTQALRTLRLRLGRCKDALPEELAILGDLSWRATLPSEDWQVCVDEAVRELLEVLRPIFSTWRRKQRSRLTIKHSGRSQWALQYLEKSIDLLQRWSRFLAPADRKTVDTGFANRLRQHIRQLQDDFAKRNADLIIQAALGRRRVGGRWQQAFAPCQLLLIENLSDLRMQMGNSKAQNMQLQRWSHRRLFQRITEQAQAAGIAVEEIWATFSSRYCATTGTPGVRANILSADDISDSLALARLRRKHGLKKADVEAGMMSLDSGGQWLLVPDGRGGIRRLHADINAAQNLQKRFWLRHQEAIAVHAALQPDGSLLTTKASTRVLGALGGPGRFVPIAGLTDAYAWCRGKVEEPSTDKDVRLMRDPSGIVFPADHWVPATTFWEHVHALVATAISSQDTTGTKRKQKRPA